MQHASFKIYERLGEQIIWEQAYERFAKKSEKM